MRRCRDDAGPADIKTSAVVLSAVSASTPAAIGHGATLAHQCAICHGATQANGIPNLAGQTSLVILKELEDFRSGARVSTVMGPFATALSAQDVNDVAAFYGDLARVPGDGTLEEIAAPRIVLNGAPMRNIPPCGSCHGALASKTGALGSTVSPPSTSRRSSPLSSTRSGTTTSASKCAMSRAR